MPLDLNTVKPTSIELHLNSYPEFTRKFGKKVKAVGGKYDAARGNTDTRFVHIPATEVDLINAVVREFGQYKRTVMIARGLYPLQLPSWVSVHEVPQGTTDPMALFTDKFNRALKNAYERGIIYDREASKYLTPETATADSAL